MPDPSLPFTVMVDDNFRSMDESERYELGRYATLEAATDAARSVVDDYLKSAYEAGMTADALISSYCMFGEDPFIITTAPEHPGVLFSAREYARWKCQQMCQGKA